MIGGLGTAPLGVTPLGMPSGGDYSEPAPLGELLANPLSERTWLLRATVKERATGDPVTLRFGTRGYWSRPADGSPREIFPPALITPYNWRLELLNAGRLTPGVAASSADIVLGNDGSLDYLLRDVLWKRGDLETLLGDGRPRSGVTLAEFGRVQRASAEGVSASAEGISIKQRDSSELLNVPLQASRYRGFGAALRHDGVDDRCDVGDFCDVGAGDSFFVLVRWRVGAVGAFQRLVGKKAGDGAVDAGWMIRQDAAGHLTAALSDGTTQAAPTTNAVPVTTVEAGEIETAIVVLDRGAGLAKVHLRGESWSTSAASIGSLATGTNLLFGRRATGAHPMNADLIEVAWGLRVPTEAEIAAWATRSLDAEQDDCVRWGLDEATGVTAFAAASAAALTASGAATLSDLDAAITGATWVGSLEGDATLAGKSKPAWYGTHEELEAYLVDPNFGIYQFHDPAAGGTLWEITEIRDAALGTADVGGWSNEGDVADLYTVSPAQGELYTSEAKCLIRFGGNGPAGKVTVTVKISVDAGSYVADRWSIAQYLATERAGLDSATQVNAGSFGDVADRAYEAGVGGGLEERTVGSAIAELCHPDTKPYFDRQSKLALFALRPPEDVTHQRVFGAGDLERHRTQRLYSTEPVDRVSVRWGRRRTTQEPGALADALTAAEKAQFAQEWRIAWAGGAAPLDELVEDSAVVHQADAQAIADVLFAVYGVLREAFLLPIPAELYQHYVGDGCGTSWSRYNLDQTHEGGTGVRRHLITGVTEVVSRDAQTVQITTLS